MIEAFGLMILGLALVLVVVSIGLWTKFIGELSSGLDPLPAVMRRPVPWGFVDLILAIAIIFFLQIAFQSGTLHLLQAQTEKDLQDPHVRLMLVGASTAASLLCVAAVMGFVWFRTGATMLDFGVDENQINYDLGLGVKAFVMLAVPVFIMQAVLTMWFPSNHPLIETVKEQQNPWPTFVVTAIAAVIGAPLLEELCFRVLLQGWLESLTGGDYAWARGMLGTSFVPYQTEGRVPTIETSPISPDGPIDAEIMFDALHVTSNGATAIEPAPREFVPALPSAADLNPYLTPREDIPLPQKPASELPPLWPTFISAFLFAIAHWSHGPDWIPLLFLAVGLGYLYRQTHRVVPCIVVHFLLNATSISLFALSLAVGPAKQP